jgi:hypothetical protein
MNKLAGYGFLASLLGAGVGLRLVRLRHEYEDYREQSEKRLSKLALLESKLEQLRPHKRALLDNPQQQLLKELLEAYDPLMFMEKN